MTGPTGEGCECTLRLPPELSTKGSRWLRALHRSVEQCWLATLEDLEAIAIETAFAVIAVRVLDGAVCTTAGGNDYETHRGHTSEGRVVRGLTLIRNAEIHGPEVIDPGYERAISIPVERGSIMRLFPRWKAHEQLPSSVRNDTRTAPSCHSAYRASVAGELVIQTLLDACRFFHGLDASIVPLAADGEPLHFPLRNLLEHGYERRHPAWPKQSQVESEQVERSQASIPKARRRQITHRLVHPETGSCIGFGGRADIATPGVRTTWVEPVEQIQRDIANGGEYYVEVQGHRPVVLDPLSESLAVASGDPDALGRLPVGTEPTISAEWLRFLEANPDLYVRMRNDR